MESVRFTKPSVAKFAFTCCLLFFLVGEAFAQLYKQSMNDPQVNFYEVVRQAEEHFKQNGKGKGSGWKGFERWRNENENKYAPSGRRDHIDPYFVSNAYQEFLTTNNVSTNSLFTTGWKDLGPYSVDSITGHYSAGMGRVESFYISSTDTNRMYLGSRSGGFWKTTNGGTSWIGGVTDTLPASGVNTIAVSPTNHDSILINVRNSSNGTTHGIYRSTDGGATWSVTNFNPVTMNWGGLGTNNRIYKIAYHPTVPNLIFVGTSSGIYRSTDNLSTWTQLLTSADIVDIQFHPTNPNIIYLYDDYYWSPNQNVVMRSTNMGVSYTTSATLTGNSNKRGYLSVSPVCPSCLYFASDNGIWKSTDEGQTFTFISNPSSGAGGFTVSDQDTSKMLYGYLDLFGSNDGGQTFNQVAYWSQGTAASFNNGHYVHADLRTAQSINGSYYVGTDGYLCKTVDNGATWQILSQGTGIRENYSLGVSQSNHYRTIVGSQDNGTSINTRQSWIEFYGADGMAGVITPLNHDWMIGSLQNGGRRRTKTGGQTQDGVTPPGQSGSWIAPLLIDPNNQMHVYSFGTNVYKSENFGSTWDTLALNQVSGSIQEAAIAYNNTNIMAISRGSNLKRSTDGGATFTSISNGLPNYSITDVTFAPNNDSILIVTYGRHQNDNKKVYISYNLGATWTNITYNLGNMPIRSVAIDHSNTSNIYLGAEIGVYTKPLTGTTWTLYNPGLPNVTINDLEINFATNTLRAATWGRGVWEYALVGRNSYPAITSTKITHLPTEENPKENIAQYVTSVISYNGALPSNVFVKWSANAPTFGGTIIMTNIQDSTWKTQNAIPDHPAGTKMYFKVYAIGNNNDTTETYKFMYTVRPFVYCNSTGNMSYGTAVTKVDFSGLNNTSGKTQPYTDYTATDSATIMVGNTYNLSVNLNTDGNYVIHSKAWIDWNHDADFTDPGEEYDLGTAQNVTNGATNLSPVSIAVPASAYIGKTTMRVSAKYNSDPTPCMTNQDGEVEDYSIIIQPIPCVPTSAQLVIDSCTTYTSPSGNYTWTSSGTYNDTIQNAGGCDSVLTIQLSINTTSATLSPSACSSYTSPSGNYTWVASGTYYDTIPNSAGCDSLLTLHLTLNNSSATLQQTACNSYTSPSGNHTWNTTGTYQDTISNVLGCDSVLTINLTINNSTSSTMTANGCRSYDAPSGKYTWTASGTYQDTLTNSLGCDSVLQINLTITAIDTTVNYSLGTSNPTLKAEETGATYQWIDCATGKPIPGATNNTFAPTYNGSFAVELTKNNCVDTSGCHSLTNVSIQDLEFARSIKLFPNPTSDVLNLEFSEVFGNIEIVINDVAGKEVLRATRKQKKYLEIDLQKLANGAYFVNITADKKKAIYKVLKQ